MAYEAQSAEMARCAVRNHGELKEVEFLSGNKDYVLVFADGTRLRPYAGESLQHEYSTYAGYAEIAQALGGTHPYSLLAFGYQGTGPGCFTTFLKTAGFDVTEKVMVDISPGVRLRRDGTILSGDEQAAEPEEPAAVAEPEAEPAAAAPAIPAADWYADPLKRHQFRYWDGSVWTDHVADNGAASLDPVTPAPTVSAAQPAAQAGPVEFDETGHVKQITFPQQGTWSRQPSGQSTYMTQSAGSLLEATEMLAKVENIPGLTYYVVETPDGNLGRDMNGFYTEAQIKTKDLHLATQGAASAPVESESLTMFGDLMGNQSSVAAVRQSGGHAKLVLMMECGRCGYKSPVETQAGDMERECYCCGTINTSFRGNVNVFLGGKMVEI